MGLTKNKLGNLIYEITRKNEQLEYGLEHVRGVSNTKEIMPTKAAVDSGVINKFYVIHPNEFIYNPRTTRMGDKVGLAFNNTDETLLFTFNNIAFGVRPEANELVLPTYLYLFFNRGEFDRYAIINSWGSATELFSFDELCDMDIDLPSIEIQQKYVDIYNAMLANQQSYERGLEDLKLACDARIEKLIAESPKTTLGNYIKQLDERNNGAYDESRVKGISTDKQIIETKANMDGVNVSSYKIVHPGEIAYVADTSRRGEKISLARNNGIDDILVSSISIVFQTTEELDSEYLALFFSRDEFDRYARFNSWGSARETFTWEDMCDVQLPVPDIKTQQAIAAIYRTYIERGEYNAKLKELIKDICPILIKGSIEEAQREQG